MSPFPGWLYALALLCYLLPLVGGLRAFVRLANRPPPAEHILLLAVFNAFAAGTLGVGAFFWGFSGLVVLMAAYPGALAAGLLGASDSFVGYGGGMGFGYWLGLNAILAFPCGTLVAYEACRSRGAWWRFLACCAAVYAHLCLIVFSLLIFGPGAPPLR